MSARRFLADQRGVAAVEMALLVPLLLTLMFGGFEAGHFIWTQHKITEAVRDGARYASRLSINQLCNGATKIMSNTTEDEIKLLTRTGQMGSTTAMPKVPGWTAAQVTVNLECDSPSFVKTGLYADLGYRGPIVTVEAVDVNYPSFFQSLGIIDSTYKLSASSHAPVIGL